MSSGSPPRPGAAVELGALDDSKAPLPSMTDMAALVGRLPGEDEDSASTTAEAAKEAKFQERLAQAKASDAAGELNAVKARRIVFHGGRTSTGLPILVFVGRRVPTVSDKALQENLFSNLILELEPLTEAGDYAILYCHKEANFLSYGMFSWLFQSYASLPRMHKKKMKNFFILHPTMWVRSFLNFMYPFVSAKVWSKIKYFDNIEDLRPHISPVPMEEFLPPFLFKETSPVPISKMPLEEAVKRSKRNVPTIVYTCIEYLEAHQGETVEGLFRVAGNAAKMAEMEMEFNRDEDIVMIQDVHSVACAMKHYLLNLPDPVIPFAFHEDFLKAIDLLDTRGEEATVEDFKAIISRFPKCHRDVLAYVMKYLRKVADNHIENKMTVTNIGVIFAPNFLKTRDSDLAGMLMTAKQRPMIITFLLDHYATIFEGAPFKPRPIVTRLDTPKASSKLNTPRSLKAEVPSPLSGSGSETPKATAEPSLSAKTAESAAPKSEAESEERKVDDAGFVLV